MPITTLQKKVLALLKEHRTPESYVAGSTPFLRLQNAGRVSLDIDVFHHGAATVEDAFRKDIETLKAAGYKVEIILDGLGLKRARIGQGDAETIMMDWVWDSAVRFFPLEMDAELGWTLSMPDLATNKALALASRGQPTDVVDMIFFHKTFLPLAGIIWAANGKDEGWTPNLMLDQMRRHSRLSAAELAPYFDPGTLDLPKIKMDWLSIVDEAEALLAKFPPEDLGCFYLERNTGKPVIPDFSRMASYVKHWPSVGGAWPSPSLAAPPRAAKQAILEWYAAKGRGPHGVSKPETNRETGRGGLSR